MAIHVHAAFVPQVAYTAGAILPYPAMVGPVNVAEATLMSFRRQLIPDFNPAVRQEWQPEEIARMAKRYADAMAAGMRAPRWTDRRIVEAAKLINQGRSFVIKSAGRSALVRSQGPGSNVTVSAESSVATSLPNGTATPTSSSDGAQPGRTLSWSRR